ncbi:hypothetical protein CDAR_590651 [Caerostris darwini]|uniref:Secreted protein n=1 Tax=Caerostris darwini TaxID=1538125 RepID=A0AAV4UCD9_9ARAC|nr:hypothetical protein CDAR_590651 [Caerostris darwini]
MRRGLRTGPFFVISSVTFLCARGARHNALPGCRAPVPGLPPSAVHPRGRTLLAKRKWLPRSTDFACPKILPNASTTVVFEAIRGKLKLKSSERVGRRRRIPEVCSLPPWQKGNWEKERNWAVALGPHLRNSALMSAWPLQRTVLIFAPFLGL